MKQQNDTLYLVQLNQVRAFTSKIARAKEVPATRCKCAATSRNVKSIESCEPERVVKKLVSLFL